MPRLALALTLALASQATLAQDTPDDRWHGGLSISGAFASGNTSSRTLAANADASRATAPPSTPAWPRRSAAPGR